MMTGEAVGARVKKTVGFLMGRITHLGPVPQTKHDAMISDFSTENWSLKICYWLLTVHYLGSTRNKLAQSIGHFLRRHADTVYMTDRIFSMTNFQSLQLPKRG
jgi:hypothetical protein